MRKMIWSLILFTLIAIILSACAPKAKTKLEVAEVTRSVFYTPLYVALEKDFLSDEGLDVTLTTTWGGDKTMTAILSNHADIGLVGSETSIYVHAQDATDPVINFAQLTQTDGTFLVAKTEQPDFTWDDIKGSNFLGQRVGGMPQMVGEFVLKKNGIDPHQDLELIQNIDFANIPGAFVSGDHEYVQLFEPTASIMEKEGQGFIVASFGEESGEIPYTVFMAKESFINDNKAEVKSFTKAIYQAQQWVEATDSTEIAKVIQIYFEDSDLDILAASIDRYKAQNAFATSPLLSEEAWENLQDIMEEAGELPMHVPYRDLVNTEIANEVIND